MPATEPEQPELPLWPEPGTNRQLAALPARGRGQPDTGTRQRAAGGPYRDA